ncbi:MAG: hypothetical protein GOMPHAMPRED_006206 [Gomphillus americanus]|uniref:EKC/KEOPS complex subunit GON7 n=1 Tax=Gomphillus americanus TaxID=1940652 RepID=A0A8H3EME5_9LECA|nr:MAG: hypothetical protein GOMPHAMPRED_006206 [Gomphillus americanus]
MADASKLQLLTADYEGPTGKKHMQHEIGVVPSDISTTERVQYLAVLRSAVVALQEETNTFLTRKMEEDNQTASGNVDDKKEEENYGEEVVDDS